MSEFRVESNGLDREARLLSGSKAVDLWTTLRCAPALPTGSTAGTAAAGWVAGFGGLIQTAMGKAGGGGWPVYKAFRMKAAYAAAPPPASREWRAAGRMDVGGRHEQPEPT